MNLFKQSIVTIAICCSLSAFAQNCGWTFSIQGDDVCYNSGIKTLDMNIPAGTTATLTGTGAISPNKFDPSVGGAAGESYPLVFTVDDGNGCNKDTNITSCQKRTDTSNNRG